MGHAADRAQERLLQAGLDPRKVVEKAQAIATLAGHQWKSTAVRLVQLPQHIGPSDSDFYSRELSNGDEVWAICRDGRLVTLMLRRSDQPATKEALRVDSVLRVK